MGPGPGPDHLMLEKKSLCWGQAGGSRQGDSPLPAPLRVTAGPADGTVMSLAVSRWETTFINKDPGSHLGAMPCWGALVAWLPLTVMFSICTESRSGTWEKTSRPAQKNGEWILPFLIFASLSF